MTLEKCLALLVGLGAFFLAFGSTNSIKEYEYFNHFD